MLTTKDYNMYLSFTLTMSRRGSWDGKWSGDNKNYVIVKRFDNTEAQRRKVRKILSYEGSSHDFGDGWKAHIQIKEIHSTLVRKIRRESDGFRGYEWMIKSICDHFEIKYLS